MPYNVDCAVQRPARVLQSGLLGLPRAQPVGLVVTGLIGRENLTVAARFSLSPSLALFPCCSSMTSS